MKINLCKVGIHNWQPERTEHHYKYRGDGSGEKNVCSDVTRYYCPNCQERRAVKR